MKCLELCNSSSGHLYFLERIGMKGIYKRPVSCSPCIDMDWMTPETCAECERLRREEVDILQLGVGFFANKAIIKRPDGTLATVLLSELTIMV